MIAVVDYKLGNLRSVAGDGARLDHLLKKAGIEVRL